MIGIIKNHWRNVSEEITKYIDNISIALVPATFNETAQTVMLKSMVPDPG